MDDKLKLFEAELGMIKSDSIMNFTIKCLVNAPDYFWEVPSSSTGKYHPAQSNGPGGLVRHTRAVVYFANKLCEVYSICGADRDLALAASILHDITKYGIPKQRYTTKTHGHEAGYFIEDLANQGQPIISSDQLRRLVQAVSNHFGKWTVVPSGAAPLRFPEAFSDIDMVVHLADVVSAQKEVSLGFLDADYKKTSIPSSKITMPFGRHQGKLFSEIASDYLRWVSINIEDKRLTDAAIEELEKREAIRAGKSTKPTAQVFVDTNIDDVPF